MLKNERSCDFDELKKSISCLNCRLNEVGGAVSSYTIYLSDTDVGDVSCTASTKEIRESNKESPTSLIGIERKGSLIEYFSQEFPSFQHYKCVQRPFGIEIDGNGKPPAVRLAVCFLKGRYRKHDRSLPQSPWFLPTGERVGKLSVQEHLMKEIISLFYRHPSHYQSMISSSDLPSTIVEESLACETVYEPRRCQTEISSLKSVDTFNLSDASKFSSSGREDVDVRMLGNGRPFLLQMFGVTSIPTKSYLRNVALRIGPEVEAINLEMAHPSVCNELLAGEKEKKKSYRAVVYFKDLLRSVGIEENELADVKAELPCWHEEQATVPEFACRILPEKVKLMNRMRNIEVKQSTPVRVLHRRAPLVRSKIIHCLHLRILNPCFGLLDLTTSPGTYVKEFVTGDHGRTMPSLGDLMGTACDIVQLDVTEVHM